MLLCSVEIGHKTGGEEPYSQSAMGLANIIKHLNFSDVWREHNLSEQQYTWMKVSNGSISGARLDRFYISQNGRFLKQLSFQLPFLIINLLQLSVF